MPKDNNITILYLILIPVKGGIFMIKFTKMHGLGNDYVYIDCTAKTGQIIKNPTFFKIYSLLVNR